MARRRNSTSQRGKHRRRPNRYNPNRPDYLAVHSPLPRFPVPSFGVGLLAGMLKTR
jgi:hypothetical protein